MIFIDVGLVGLGNRDLGLALGLGLGFAGLGLIVVSAYPVLITSLPINKMLTHGRILPALHVVIYCLGHCVSYM